jgi:hypothetical protein
MPENRPSEKDEALSSLLQTWKPEAQLPPRFQEAVWNRIACAEAARTPALWQAVLRWVEQTLSRPALAVSYVAVLLFAGLGAGYWHAEGKTTQAAAEMRTRYVQAVDPYQMPRN